MTDTQTDAGKGAGRYLPLIIAFVLGAVIAALIVSAMPKQTSQETTTDAATSQEQQETQDAVTAETDATTEADKTPLDVAATFPSWNADSASLAELTAFVEDVCNPDSPNYLEPADRIVVSDMDGTIISEKAPMFMDYMLLIHRVLDDPNHEAALDVVEVVEQIRDFAMQGKKNSDLSPARRIAIAHEFVGMTPEEFRDYVKDFLDTESVVGFDGMTYGESFYKPMLEVFDYLRANDFDIFMVSACEREVTRAAVERLGIPADHVIATNIAYATTGQGDTNPKDYTMEQDEQVIMSEPMSSERCEKNGKTLAIAREIGKKPILAFGNSSGDYSMMNYAESAGGMGLLVVADDEVREYGSKEKSAEQYDLVDKENWTAFSMVDDWATIYGEGVVKTELPGLAEEALDEAA